ncbi:right-handed parallel beta-helix repeat-containing protein [Dickeya oryzae]|uniref:pectate lyase PelN n=1 Tax=Dickeya oryzae TaxID=1240404 RepID=UPI001AECF271|nr:pectate lyase PelN [Dickeya oryzae]MBP2845754.1 right-handed parallel beta-helix repeat-containing protein [Dickeya oryzae]
MNMNKKFLPIIMGCVLTGTAAQALAAEYYLAPNGSDSGNGSKSAPWKSFARAQQTLSPGDRLWVRGGTYTFTAGLNSCASQTDIVNAITLNKSGTSGKRIEYVAYTGETPVFDFSQMKDDCRVKGFNVVADWVTLKGLEIKGVPQNNNKNHESWGVWIKGSNNRFERLDIHHIMGTGLFLQNGAYNTVLNSDSHHNYDPLTSNGAGQSGDGFGAHIAANMPGNIFSGCRAWSNSDDGFDLINAYSSVTIENSWAWSHGYLPGTTTSLAAGNGNGFKAGGYDAKYVSNAPKHIVRNSVAFLNKAAGFYANHHPVANDFFNNTSYRNAVNFSMRGIDESGNAIALGTLRNNISYAAKSQSLAYTDGANMRYNSWNYSNVISDAEFQSVSTTGWDAPRQADGSLPVLKHLRLATGSWMINKGGDVKIAYQGAAPDLGAFELK